MKIKRAEAEDIWKMVAIEGADAEALRPLSLFSQFPSQLLSRARDSDPPSFGTGFT